MPAWELLESPEHGLVTEARPHQVALARYLRACMEAKLPAMVEAGTGTGKSYAYLLNALESSSVETRVVIATAMRSLQQQLLRKDLPYLTQHPQGPKRKFARLLGRSNYGCKRRVHLNVIDKNELAACDEFFDTVEHWVWEDAPFKLRRQMPKALSEYSVSYCSKSRCDYMEECAEKGFLAAKTAAEEAHVLIVNHALVGSDIHVWSQHEVSLFDSYRTLIVDEGHKFPEYIRNALACEMPNKFFDKAAASFHDLTRQLEGDPTTIVMGLDVSWAPKTLPHLRELDLQYAAMFRETQRRGAFGDSAFAFARLARQSVSTLAATCYVGTPYFRDFLKGKDSPRFDASLRTCESVMRLLYFLDEYANRLGQFATAIDLATTEHLKYVVGIESDDRGNHTIKTIPLEIGGRLNKYYSEREVTPIYLSATLQVQGSFQFFADEVGYDLTPRQGPQPAFSAGTPFNYAKQAWCHVPAHLPMPTQEGYLEKSIDETYELLMANEGHAFVLFTSFRDLNAFADGLRRRNYPYPLLCQDAKLKAQGRKRFMTTPNATLLGTRSFWEGIDVPGLHLTLVVIPKLPFPHPDDAIFKAKKALAEDAWFQQVSMPTMLTDLRQMVGRLIRSTTDYGVVALLDTRIHHKRYGRQVIEATGMKWGTNTETAKKLLRQLSERRKRQCNTQKK